MTVKLCKECGQPLYRKPSKCRWCQTPVRKITALHYSIFMVFLAGYLFMEQTPIIKSTSISKAKKQIPTPQVNAVKTQPPKKQIRAISVNIVKAQHPKSSAQKKPIKVKIKQKVVKPRPHSPFKSPIPEKLKKRQPLTLVSRPGNQIPVLRVEKKSTQGRIRASKVGKLSPSPTKAMTPQQAYRAFRKYFKQFNADIKTQKGMAFFKHVEYLDQGVIEVTATSIFLSAPEIYKQNYLKKITKKWEDFREPGLPTIVRIVDAKGILRMENKRS